MMAVPASMAPVHRQLQAELRACLGSDLAVVCSDVDGDPASLWPEERAAVSNAVPRRQREFAAGRAAARTALRQLGRRECAIPIRRDRSPAWPEGLTGSISHSRGVCVVVMALKQHWGSLGVDVEEDGRVEPDLWPSICLREELDTLAQMTSPTARKSRVTRLFGAKEAFFKWQYPDTQEMLDFHDAEIRLDPTGSTFEVFCRKISTGASRHAVVQGRQFLVEGQILSLVAK